MLDEQVFNLEIRKLLKLFGIAAQREIEIAAGLQQPHILHFFDPATERRLS